MLWALGGAAWGLLLAALVGAAFALAKAWFAPVLSIWLPAAIAGGALLLGFAGGWFYRRPLKGAATAVDAHYRLKDRAATALEFATKTEMTPAHQLALSEPIPLGHRQTIRKYFESIRPNDAETDRVQERIDAP